MIKKYTKIITIVFLILICFNLFYVDNIYATDTGKNSDRVSKITLSNIKDGLDKIQKVLRSRYN